MKFALALALALQAVLVAPSMGHEARNRTVVGSSVAEDSLSRRINALQGAVVEQMRASEAAEIERRTARLSVEINTLQESLVQAMREGRTLD